MPAKFTRLVRFQDAQGAIHYGEAGADWTTDLHGKTVPTYDISSPFESEYSLTGQAVKVAKVLCPLATTPLMYAIGLNYKAHAEEAGLPIPKYPAVFTKFGDMLADPYQDIAVPQVANSEMDYEAELCIVLGKDLKDFSDADDIADYVLGYTAGNDVSSRFWAWNPQSGTQWGYSKSFDHFGPIGPVITSPAAIKDVQSLKLKTWVNQTVKQNSNTDNMIFDVKTILKHISVGRTLKQGSVVMTGTPDGVAACAKPQVYLNSGDLVEIEIEGIGKIANKMVFL